MGKIPTAKEVEAYAAQFSFVQLQKLHLIILGLSRQEGIEIREGSRTWLRLRRNILVGLILNESDIDTRWEEVSNG